MFFKKTRFEITESAITTCIGQNDAIAINVLNWLIRSKLGIEVSSFGKFIEHTEGEVHELAKTTTYNDNNLTIFPQNKPHGT